MDRTLTPPLHHLVRPEHILNPRLRLSEQQKQHCLQGCIAEWKVIQTNHGDSLNYKQAHRKLVALTAFLVARVKAVQASTHRAPIREDPFQRLIQETSGARPIPSWSDFEAGISAFHEPAAQNPSALEVAMSGMSLSESDAKDQLEECVSAALTFLGCDVASTTAEEIEAVWALIDVRGGTHEELEAYLKSTIR